MGRADRDPDAHYLPGASEQGKVRQPHRPDQVKLHPHAGAGAEAIKVRDRSNFNVVEHNTFSATGDVSAYRDQFCDQACVNAHPGTSRQCAGNSGCSIPKGQQRLYAGSNTLDG